jgi:hypothetical protein
MRKLLLIAMSGAFFIPALTSCNNGSSTREENADSTAAMPAGEADAANENDYDQKLTYKQYSFSVNSKGQGALRKMTITGRDSASASDYETVNSPIEGDIYYASTADLNNDGKPEVYAFTRGKDSAGYSKVYAYAFDKNTGKQINFPALTPKQSAEYKGHDSIYIDNQYIVRSFSTDDASAQSARKSIRYVLRPGGADSSLMLVQVQ